jgi:hypothetical protein
MVSYPSRRACQRERTVRQHTLQIRFATRLTEEALKIELV